VKHLFIIPGWYPHRPCFPFEGLYIREQAEAIGELHPDVDVTLSLWDQGRGEVSLGHLLRSPGCVLRPLELEPEETTLAPNLIEQRKPARSWNPRFFAGNRDAILDANRINLDSASARWGRPDVLHAHVSYPAGWVAMQLSRERSIPYVITEHMGPFPLPYYKTDDGSLNPLLRQPLANADATIAVSPALADQIESYGLPRPRFIPNLVNENRYRAEPFRADQPFTFLTLCGMEQAKGIHDLLEAISKLRQRIPPDQWKNVRFRLIGDGPQRTEFQKHAHQLELDPSITWGLVSREQAPAEFQSCDCYVLPSHRESFGIVLVEALASGRPLIATRCGGPETIVNESNGILVDPKDPEALSRALESMWDRARQYDPRQLREQFLVRYSRPVVVASLVSIYEGLIAIKAAGHTSTRST
jgi:glycosyltransferase involved in cell wall biosynthesis